ncbi:class I SAM-dependent methyltransferase [Mesorhizobium sp. B2-6-2]|uniref:class I SAM-dependent methyltransferase n=1 Tax=Mesorhizobium sp. B2-6-2 TaxID=2589915 RepID=UPI0011281B0C|nr:class I SAM-dependent methyltransferase [Mesorhizobium sp. B2-6-2]TPJ82899.1 class I SAM-dependent methyltransferase [Mesorhizobium sp. B2-6-2]
MAAEPLKTLFYPFEAEALPLPRKHARVLFLGAEPGLRLPAGFEAALHLVQGFRPHFRTLQASGYAVTPRVEGSGFDMALVLAGRHRGQNEQRVADAIERVAPGGLVIIAGSKDDGIDSLRKRMASSDDKLASMIAGHEPGGVIIERRDGSRDVLPNERLFHPQTAKVPLSGHLSKHHGVVFWLERTPQAEAFAKSIHDWQNGWPLVDRRFRTAPGMFSFDRIDAGSKLLAANLPDDLKGNVADFCAGWGYLAVEVLQRPQGLTALDLYEADFEALEAARLNVHGGAIEPRFFWTDLLTEAVERRYDAIVMNPPFHRGRASEPEIGAGMIRAASKALKPGGRLFMVANRQLPYQQALSAAFASHAEIARDGMFKVFSARR